LGRTCLWVSLQLRRSISIYKGTDADIHSISTGPNVRIAAGARVKDAILMEGAFVDVSDNASTTGSLPTYRRARTDRVVMVRVF